MIDFDDGDQLLRLIGIGIAIGVLLMLVTLGLAATNIPQQSAEEADVDWQLERINDSHARIVHDGGESIRTEALTVTVDGSPRHPPWTASTLSEGESGVVRLEDASKLTLLWQQSEGDRDVLGRWDLADDTTDAVSARAPEQ